MSCPTNLYNVLRSINKCALNFLLFFIASFTEDKQIWYLISSESVQNARLIRL